MAQRLKARFPMLVLGVGAGLTLLVAGFAYYQHRVDAAAINELAHTAVQQKLEGELEARANGISKVTGALLAPAIGSGDKAAVASIAGRLLDERDVERVEVLDARGTVLFTATNPLRRQTDKGPLAVNSAIANGQGSLTIWISRASVEDAVTSVRAQLEHQQGDQFK